MKIAIEKYTQGLSLKKKNKAVTFINENHVYPLHKLLEENKLSTIESIGLEYITENDFWDYDNLYKVSINLSILKNEIKQMMNDSNPILFWKEWAINYKNIYGVECMFLKKNSLKSKNLFDLDSPNKNDDIIKYISKKMGEKLSKKIPINFFDYFIIYFNGNEPKVITTMKGMQWLHENK